MVILLYNYSVVSDSYTKYKRVFKKHNGILRASNAVELGVPPHIIYKMVETGDLIREAQGIYRLKGSASLSNPDLVQISLRIPRAVVCLISALSLHNLTTETPHQIYIALPRDVKTPRIEYPPIKVFHLSEKPYLAGIEEIKLDGVNIKIYGPEKTIADCFKFRTKIGIDIALEALKDYLRSPYFDIQRMMTYAKVNRVENIMRPYLEALL